MVVLNTSNDLVKIVSSVHLLQGRLDTETLASLTPHVAQDKTRYSAWMRRQSHREQVPNTTCRISINKMNANMPCFKLTVEYKALCALTKPSAAEWQLTLSCRNNSISCRSKPLGRIQRCCRKHLVHNHLLGYGIAATKGEITLFRFW